jgi:hypothetical protein
MNEDMERVEKMHAMRAAKLEAQRERDGGGLAARQDELANALGRTRDYLEQLEQRLQPVLRDPEPTSEKLHGTPRPAESPLSGFLRSIAGNADDLTHQLEDLIGRVDL